MVADKTVVDATKCVTSVLYLVSVDDLWPGSMTCGAHGDSPCAPHVMLPGQMSLATCHVVHTERESEDGRHAEYAYNDNNNNNNVDRTKANVNCIIRQKLHYIIMHHCS